MEDKWKKETPTQDGFYWFQGTRKEYYDKRDYIKPVIVEIETLADRPDVFFTGGSSGGVSLNDLCGQWVGPLEAPADGK